MHNWVDPEQPKVNERVPMLEPATEPLCMSTVSPLVLLAVKVVPVTSPKKALALLEDPMMVFDPLLSMKEPTRASATGVPPVKVTLPLPTGVTSAVIPVVLNPKSAVLPDVPCLALK